MIWGEESEKNILAYRAQGLTHIQIAEKLGSTLSAVKHKIRRLQQSQNLDKFKHSEEKRAFALDVLADFKPKRILETHAGFGGMTEFYNALGKTVSIDIDRARVEHLKSLLLVNVTELAGDSEREIYGLIHRKERFQIVDIDPYGMPSRLFPMAIELVDDGYLFLTLPQLGCTQINKITIEHYRAVYGIDISLEEHKQRYADIICARIADYGFWYKKQVQEVGRIKIGRMYRIAFKVNKQNLLDRVGLKVNRKAKT